MQPRLLRTITLITVVALLLVYTSIVWLADISSSQFINFSPLFAVGAAGATIANASGVGGGVVFVPVFDYINTTGLIALSATQIIATSFFIQCFGMTTGSLTWLNKMRHSSQPSTGIAAAEFWRIIWVVLACCIPALLITQYGLKFMPASVLFWFKSLSIALGCALLVSVWRDDKLRAPKTVLHSIDLPVLAVLGAIGGFATALFSVGVGELVALYLFIRNYPLVTCAATAVIITAFTVVIGIFYHLLKTDIPWLLLAFAAPGAVTGGYIARGFAYFLGTHRLKMLASLWIIGSSAYLLWQAH